jgi:AcrR family transcriptional regulator
MGRPAAFDQEAILDAATCLLARHGPVRTSVTKVAAELGAPSGSIYHRFPGRAALFAATWLRAVRRFQAGYLAALDDPDVERAAVGAATHIPRWCSTNLDSAILLYCYRPQDLVDAWPADLDGDLRSVNDGLQAALRQHAVRRYGVATSAAERLVTFALMDIPAAAVRRPLEQRRPPGDWVLASITVASQAVLAQHPHPSTTRQPGTSRS